MTLYQTQPDRSLRAKALAKEYGIGGHSHDFLDGSRGFVNHDWNGLEFDHYPDHQKITLKWAQVEQYIDLMIQSDRYLTDKEKEHYTPPVPVTVEPDATLKECSMLEKAIVLCLLNTGVRRGELAGLTWKDVNFRDGTIHVSKSLLVFPNYGYQLTTTKESNIRDVDVAPEFMAFLKDYHEQWKSRKKLMGASWQKNLEKKGAKYAQSLLDLRGNDFVICNDYGFPINPDSYAALVRRVGKKAGIEKIHPHMFRHTFVSILLSNPNIGVATVAAEAGHAQPSTTLAIYTQVYDRRRDEIRKQMSKELYK